MDSSGNDIPPGVTIIPPLNFDDYPFHPGVRIPYTPRQREQIQNRNRNRSRNRPTLSLVARGAASAFHKPWDQRIQTAPTPGTIRLLTPPAFAKGQFLLETLWYRDMSLKEWVEKIDKAVADISDNPIAVTFRPSGYIDSLKEIFHTNQRMRWYARVVIQRWTQRVWRKRTQCNVDMIDMQPIKDADAILLTDVKHRQIYRFHRRDVITNLLSNIGMADEMLPAPRHPTNPWTNARLTPAQTIAICHAILHDYAKRGQCPPVLFSAYWSSRFHIRRFHDENSALLSQQAVRSYFKDLHEYNMETVFETVTNLLNLAEIDYITTSFRRWLRQTPQTAIHQDWLRMARDYTLYINLHVQVRPHWYSDDHIYYDVRRLWDRTEIPDPASQRLRLLRTALTESNSIPVPTIPLITQSLLFQAFPDASGSQMSADLAIQFIQNALFRL